MSCDLMVFDPQAAPSDRAAFLRWYRQQTQWQEGHHYDDPGLSTPGLRAWFLDMIPRYPMLNGPYATEDDTSRATDYSIGRSAIYAAFAWSEAAEARETAFRLAEQHRLGFFDVSTGQGGVWIPAADGRYTCIHGPGARQQDRKWWEFWKRP